MGQKQTSKNSRRKLILMTRDKNDPSRKTFRGDCSETSSLESSSLEKRGVLSKLKWRHLCQTFLKIKPRGFLYVCGYLALKPF
jgi:hypothetical protein